MNKISYFLPKTVFKITLVIFITQLLGEMSGIFVRKAGFEDTILVCFIAFMLASFYALAVVAINASREKGE